MMRTINMAIKSQVIEGTKIINEINSSNLVKTIYDTADSTLIAEFKNGAQYKYVDVPHVEYVKLRSADSQGTYFNTQIAKKYKYSKL